MTKKTLVRATLAGIVIAGIGLLTLRTRADRPEIVLSGSMEGNEVEVGSLLGGRVAAVHVKEGDTVAAGQPLVTFEPDLLDRQIAEQQGRMAVAEASVRKAEAGPRREEVERARLAWTNADAERRRLQRLLQEGIVARQQYDDVRTRAEAGRQAYQELEKGTRPEDVSAARAALEAERGRLGYLLRQKQEAVVRAPSAGTVESFELRPGDLVAPQQPVASILEPGQLWVLAYVPEPKLGTVRLGAPATITVDTWPDRRFEGRVVEIGNRAEYTPRNVQTRDQRNETVFRVKVAVQAAELKPGMAAVVRLSP